MRVLALLAVVGSGAPVSADPLDRLEASGFVGVDYLGDDIGLGGSDAPEQRPQTAPMFGARLTYIALRADGGLRFDLGGEAELALTSAWTGYGFDTGRSSYFAPILHYRANVIARLGSGWLQPHAVVGIGGATLKTSSPYMTDETDSVLFWGLGATFAVADRWQLRLDGRQGSMDAMSGGTTSTYELAVSIATRFGESKAPAPRPVIEEVVVDNTPPPPPPPPDRDSDNDGLPDKLDACPYEAESVNGIDDQDGCPEPDPDKDGIIGASDQCPDRPEDFDKFQDTDGCTDEDNDADGVADVRDACPNEAETKNGVSDDDGCADAVPPAIATAFASAARVKFEPNRARLSNAAKSALDQPLITMLNNPKLKVTVTVHPDQPGEKAAELAKKRAEVVKWYLVEQGIVAAQLTTEVGPVAAKKAPLLVLAPGP